MFLREKYIDKIKQYIGIVNSVFLIWSRQVWKTSILKSLLEFDIIDQNKSFYLNFDDIALQNNLLFENTFSFISFLEFNYSIDFKKIDYFLFDEVKNIKNFNLLLKSLIDEYDKKRFICTSSWNYEWTNEIIEWLAWRSLQINVYPLDFKEFMHFKNKKLPKIIDENLYNSLKPFLIEYITFWWYPQVVISPDKNSKILILKSIIDSVFMIDIKQFIKQEKIFDLQRLFVFLATNIWNPFSIEGISNFIWEKNYNIKLFLEVLNKNFLAFDLKTFNTNKRNELKWKNKIYLSDFWIMNYFLKRSEITQITWDYIEMFVFLNLYYNLDSMEFLYFWQNLNKSEIDFILKRWEKLIGVEVKVWNKDNIPKIFNSFLDLYSDKIDYFIKTTSNINNKRTLKNKDVFFRSFLGDILNFDK